MGRCLSPNEEQEHCNSNGGTDAKMTIDENKQRNDEVL